MKRIQKSHLLSLMLAGTLLFTGCLASTREALNTKIKEGEVLLQQERYEEAVAYFEELYETNWDSISLMEKLELSITLKTSRESLKKAEAYLAEEQFAEALKALEGVYNEDEKGVLLKEALLEDLKVAFVSKSHTLLEKAKFDEALALLEEYQTLRGADEDIMVLHETILQEKEKEEMLEEEGDLLLPEDQP